MYVRKFVNKKLHLGTGIVTKTLSCFQSDLQWKVVGECLPILLIGSWCDE